MASSFKISLVFLGLIFWILHFWYLTDLFFPSPPPPPVFLFNPAFPCNTPLHFIFFPEFLPRWRVLYVLSCQVSLCRDFNSKVSPQEVLLFLIKDRWHSCYFCLLPEINQVYVLAQISFYRVSVLESVLEHEEDLILLFFLMWTRTSVAWVCGWITVLSRKRKCYFYEVLKDECSPIWHCLISHIHFWDFFFFLFS